MYNIELIPSVSRVVFFTKIDLVPSISNYNTNVWVTGHGCIIMTANQL